MPSYDPLVQHFPHPLITVILRTHEGHTKYLHRSLGSIFNQDLDPQLFEVVVASDGPMSQETTELLETLVEGEEVSVGCVETTEKSGYYCLPSNLAILQSKAPYIAHLDADNEWLPNHLSGLLRIIRRPHPDNWLPDFTYSRRRYVRDEGAGTGLPTGDSPLILWEPASLKGLVRSPQGNFVDSSDFLISRSGLYVLAERTGCMWNQEIDRFGDWDLAKRLAECGLRGQAVDQVTHIYHWTGSNLQVTRPVTELGAVPVEVYDTYQRRCQHGA